MLSGDDTAPLQDLGEQFIQRRLNPNANLPALVIGRHDVDVNIAVTRVTEASDGKSIFALQRAAKSTRSTIRLRGTTTS